MCNDVSLAFAVSCRNSKVFEMKKNLPLEVVHLKRINQNHLLPVAGQACYCLRDGYRSTT